MSSPSNYPPGVSGNEPQITGEDDYFGEDPFDERDYEDEFPDYDFWWNQRVADAVHQARVDDGRCGNCTSFTGPDHRCPYNVGRGFNVDAGS